MGILDIPSYDKTGGIIALLLSIFLAGLGVLIWGIVKGQKDVIILGVILFLLSFIGIGWILAVIWGVMVLVKSV